ncbi:MAG: hypothetical protein OXI96_08160 [Acidimicrobiaceae bacterium]|nr:hypothetical protein [Acidimicrobiaceae bacterium]
MIGERRPEWGVDWGISADVPQNIRCVHDDAAAAEIVAVAYRDGSSQPPIMLAGGDMARTLGAGDSCLLCESFGADTPSKAKPVSSRPCEATKPREPSESDTEPVSRVSSRPCKATKLREPSESDTEPVSRVASRPCKATKLRVDVGSVRIDGRQFWFLAHLVARRSWWWGRVLTISNASFMGEWNIAPRAHPGDGRLHVLDTQCSIAVRWVARRRLRFGTHVPHPDIHQRRITQAQFSFDAPLDIYLDKTKHARTSQLEVSVIPAALEIWVSATRSDAK